MATLSSVIRHFEGIKSVVVVGSYVPRKCGIATFNTDLVEAPISGSPGYARLDDAMNDRAKGHHEFDLPEIKLDHMKALTDNTGVLQHANYTIPDRTHGYPFSCKINDRCIDL